MKKIWMIVVLGFGLALSWGPLQAAATSDSSQDVIKLQNGNIVKGEIVQENKDKVVIMVDGAKKSYERSKIANITYATDSDDASVAAGSTGSDSGEVGASVPKIPVNNAGDALTAQLAESYSVPERDVIWVRQQGISDADLPMIFQVAAEARVQTRVVVRLRLERWTWDQIETHFGLRATGIDESPQNPVVVYPYSYPYSPYYYGPGWGWGGGWGGRHGGWGHHWR